MVIVCRNLVEPNTALWNNGTERCMPFLIGIRMSDR